MCVTVLFGDDREELFNPDCGLVHFLQDLKRRCGLDAQDQVDLMDSRGTVMELEGREFSLDRASASVKNRTKYLLVRVCREAGEKCRYVPLLTKTRHPEFRDLLRRLSTGPRRRQRGRRPPPAKPGGGNQNPDTC